MKKVFRKLFLTILLLFPISVFAAGNISASPTYLTIEVGSSKTFTITAYNTIGDVSISSSNSGVASVNISEWGTGMVDEGQTRTGTVTVTGKSVGTATITLVLDAATFDAEDLAGQTRTITVNVIAKPTTPSQPTQPSNPGGNNTGNNKPSNNKSTNNNLKDIKVDGYNLKKVNANNYTLEVMNNVDSINISATAEDTKAKVTGTGTHKLQVGENNIQIIVTSESGAQNKITIKVTRKDGYYLEDLDDVLKNNEINDINIIIKADTKITSQDLEKIKSSKKIVKFNYYKDGKSLIYSWIIDGTKLKSTNELITTISNDSDNKSDVLKLSNYADGLVASLKQTSNLPDGTKIKLFVGDKYQNNDLVNVYAYVKSNEKLGLVKKQLKVENGYVEFDVTDASDYFVTMSTIPSSDKVVTPPSKSSSPVLLVIIVILSLLVIGLAVAFIVKNKKNKNDDNNNIDNSIVSNNYGVVTDTSTVSTISASPSIDETVVTDTSSANTISASPSINETYNDNVNQLDDTSSNII